MRSKGVFVGGGHSCRAWSILRWFRKPGRLSEDGFEEQLGADTDSVLMLKQMVIAALADESNQPGGIGFFLERPRNPLERPQIKGKAWGASSNEPPGKKKAGRRQSNYLER